MAFKRFNLAAVFQETINMIDQDPELSQLARNSVKNTIVWNDCSVVKTNRYSRKSDGNSVVVSAGTSFDTARALSEKYNGTQKIAVLNFANAYNPGGGVLIGASAQEECLCRCSTLYKSLKRVAETPDFYRPHKKQRIADSHDLNQKGMIYTPDVAIFRTDDYEVLKKPVLVDVITSAAPEMFLYRCTEETLRAIHTEKAKAILDIAIENGVDSIVLGAFGCGAFENPPHVVADVYKQVLNTAVGPDLRYKDCFKEIVFAIRANDKGEKVNFEEFKKILNDAGGKSPGL